MRKIRILSALIVFMALTAAFVDFTGVAAHWAGWLAKIQFGPAVLSLSAVTVIVLLALTALFGRVYCSVICPLGILQDGIIFLRRILGFKNFAAASVRVRRILRGCALVLFLGGGFLGLHFTWLEPYSIYGRIASALAVPAYRSGNNVLADWAARRGSDLFYTTEIVLPSVAVLAMAIAFLVLIIVLAAWKGRFWCVSVCPVGTVLGFVSRFALFRPRIDAAACISCGKCVRTCRCGCIDLSDKKIDGGTCVSCFDCVAVCPKGALKWKK